MMKKKILIVQIFDRLRVINPIITTYEKNEDLTMDVSYWGLVRIFQQSYTLANTLSSGVWIMGQKHNQKQSVTGYNASKIVHPNKCE